MWIIVTGKGKDDQMFINTDKFVCVGRGTDGKAVFIDTNDNAFRCEETFETIVETMMRMQK